MTPFSPFKLQGAYLSNTEMDIDTIKSSKKKQARVQKRNQKPRNSIVFQKRLSTTKKGPKRKWGDAEWGAMNGLFDEMVWQRTKGVWESTIPPAIHVHMFHSLCLIYHTFKDLRYYFDFARNRITLWPGESIPNFQSQTSKV
jgi:hypothetical protein